MKVGDVKTKYGKEIGVYHCMICEKLFTWGGGDFFKDHVHLHNWHSRINKDDIGNLPEIEVDENSITDIDIRQVREQEIWDNQLRFINKNDLDSYLISHMDVRINDDNGEVKSFTAEAKFLAQGEYCYYTLDGLLPVFIYSYPYLSNIIAEHDLDIFYHSRNETGVYELA